MNRLLLVGGATGLGVGAGLRARNAKPSSTPPATAPVRAAAPAKAPGPNDWPTVGNDPASMKYSPLTQITPANVGRLTTAWTYDMGVPASGYTITPIVIGNVM